MFLSVNWGMLSINGKNQLDSGKVENLGVFCVRISFGEVLSNSSQSGMNIQTCPGYFFFHYLLFRLSEKQTPRWDYIS